MLLIVISPETNLLHEHEVILQLFDQGLTHFHLRKPNASKIVYENYIKEIPIIYHNNIIIHSHHELTLKYNLKGIHFTEKTKEHSRSISLKQQLTIKSRSASFHSIEALQQNQEKYDYVFLSPIFDSISKKKHRTTYKEDELILFLKAYHKPLTTTKVIALGGVTIANLSQLKKMGFDGVAVLGSIWQTADAVASFNKLRAHLLS